MSPPNLFSKSGDTPMTTAAWYGFEDVFMVLASHPEIDLEEPDTDGRTPLLLCARYGNVKLTKYLIEQGVRPDTPKKVSQPKPWSVKRGCS